MDGGVGQLPGHDACHQSGTHVTNSILCRYRTLEFAAMAATLLLLRLTVVGLWVFYATSGSFANSIEQRRVLARLHMYEQGFRTNSLYRKLDFSTHSFLFPHGLLQSASFV